MPEEQMIWFGGNAQLLHHPHPFAGPLMTACHRTIPLGVDGYPPGSCRVCPRCLKALGR